jgi:peptidoglycan/xylan/chitin deacetylase (PgdA/CDA1 family)
MYHRVATVESDPLELCVAPERFRDQLEVVASLGEIVPLQTLVQDRRRRGLTVAITFDDGYADNALAAAPLLAAQDAPATVFVVAGAVGSGRPFWWDRLAALIFNGDGSAYWSAWERLRKLPAEQIERVLESLESRRGQAADLDAGTRPVSEEELRSLAGGPVEIGGHTVSHPSLPSLPEASRRDEIALGRERLESLLGRPVETFAYPYGDHDAATVRLVREDGFRLACTIHENVLSRFSSPHLLPRYAVRDWPADELERRLAAWTGRS